MSLPMARVARVVPPSPASRRVEMGYVVLDAALMTALVGLALALVWAPIPERTLPMAEHPPAPGRVQTL